MAKAKKRVKRPVKTSKKRKKAVRKPKAVKKTKKAVKRKKVVKKKTVKKKVVKQVIKKTKDLVLEGNIVDVRTKKIFPGKIIIKDGKIYSIEKTSRSYDQYLLPGFVDAHIHIESSMMVPSRFAQTVVPHGTVATVSDPHEIANVMGVKGINYMIREAKQTPVKIYYTAPSCVPCTEFETTGASLNHDDVDMLLKVPSMVALGEVMDFPGVVRKDKELMKKIRAAKQNKKPIDGHCPLLAGEDLKKYVAVGISTEHEATTAKEAAEKSKLGVKIMIRESSSKKNMEDLLSVAKNPRSTCFLVSDDKHASDLIKGHMDITLKKIVSLGVDPIKAIQMVSLNPVRHYKLDVGLLQKDDPADIVVVDNLTDFNVLETWIDGKQVAKNKKSSFVAKPAVMSNSIRFDDKSGNDFKIKNYSSKERQIVRVIRAEENSLLTQELHASLPVDNNEVLPDPSRDVIKLAVVERYGKNRIGLGFVMGFGLKQGAVASSVSHDSHNITVAGCNDDDMAKAVNEVKKICGGIVVVNNRKVMARIALPVAGLMSTKPVNQIAQDVAKAKEEVRKLGGIMKDPFSTLSIMSLLVVPKLKLSDRGLFNGESYKFTDLFVETMSPF